ncbi:GATOR complex protein wdr59 [Coemansia sp. RSA 1200]|nr:GATOR complex protein wdr59 [Coemansia sp. RSA 1200]
MDGSVVKLCMTREDLVKYKQIVIRGTTVDRNTEEKLFQHCKRYGMVCGIRLEDKDARVWFETREAAESALNNLGNSELYSGMRLEHVTGSSSHASDNAPMEVIVLDKRNDNGGGGGGNSAVYTISDSSDSDASMISVDMLRPSDPLTSFHKKINSASTPLLEASSTSSVHSASRSPGGSESHSQMASGQLRKGNVARKSTGGRPPAQKQRLAASRGQSKKIQIRNGPNGVHRYSSGESDAITDDPTQQPESSFHSGSENGSLDTESESMVVTDFFKMEPWRAKAPFIYNFIYRRLPGASAIEDGRHCLSMAWKTGSAGNMLDLFVSQGNRPAVNAIRSWGKDYNASTASRSEIALTSFQIPTRGSLANACSLLNAFNLKEAGIMHRNRQRDGNEFAVSTLKLYDEGRILFGCGTSSIIVWDTNGIKHKESLMILSDVDGVYDVGRDYVVSSSTNGTMGVWKSGSRNYMWRYNDTRRFKTASHLDASTTPIITALQVDADDRGAFIGDISGCVSHSDFRGPHIHRLSSTVCKGAPRSFANYRNHGLLVGTDNGFMSLLDTRYIHSTSPRISVVRKYSVPEASLVNRIRVCPHDSEVLACSIDHNVYIYRNDGGHQKGDDDAVPLFHHHAHQSHIVDFDWHPSPEYRYTIGSAESGEGLESGEIQIWEPSSVVL